LLLLNFLDFADSCLGVFSLSDVYDFMTNKPPPENAKKFACEKCAFECSKLCDYNRHLDTAKHKRLINANDISAMHQPDSYKCICGNEYKHAPSLCKHKKKCTYTPTPPLENTIVYATPEKPQPTMEPGSGELIVLVKELMLQLTAKDKQLTELQNTMKEMIPHLGNNNNTNSNNTFNVQFFLENDCRNAQSIQEFVKSIEFNQEHLVSMTKDGYVDTISNILIQALNKMAITDRPLHCTDLKRETVYIKDKESWNKSTSDAPLMNRVINCIEQGCVIEVKNYVDQTPESKELDTPQYDFYHKAHWNTLGAGEDASKLNKKIYKKVLPQVKLDKQPVS
jgi:hypothetical protein